jgi:hypothetical protein
MYGSAFMLFEHVHARRGESARDGDANVAFFLWWSVILAKERDHLASHRLARP